MLRAHSDKDAAYEQQVEDQIRQFKVGGLCFFQGTPEKQAALTNRYQADARLPLMITMDAEWGIGMRMKESTVSFPKQLMLGAIRDNKLIYDFGLEVSRQCRRLGVHLDFAPVADINNNAANPVINDRSFGEDKFNVTSKCFQYMMGLQDGGTLACAKHFPGHGDTNVDSHFDLPLISHSIERLDSVELFPFRVLAQYGIASVIVAHLRVPAIDNRPNRPTTLSRNTVQTLLRGDMGFDGLIFTDAMEMQAVAKYYAPGEANVEALRAGNDVILLPGNVPATVLAIQSALDSGSLDRQQVYASVKRILRAKYRLGLTQPQHIEEANIRSDMNSPQAIVLKRKLIENAITLVRNKPGIVGFEAIEKYKFASLALGDTNRTIFQTTCGNFAPVTHLNASKDLDSLQQSRLLDSLRRFDVVLVSLHNMRSRAGDNFGLTDNEIRFIQNLCKKTTVALTVFGNPYSLKYFDDVPILLEAYNEDPITQEIAAQGLFGAVDLQGRLPVTVTPAAVFGQGVQINYSDKRLGYDLPEAQGMNSDTLALMESLVQDMINTGAAPGCQILVARNNKIIWQKAYGFHTYEQTEPVRLDNLYDLASVTKIGATTISAMMLADQGKIRLDSTIRTYIPELKQSNKRDLTLREILAHHAGLQPWIPFYQKTLENGLPDAHIYHRDKDADSEIPVAKDMWMDNDWVDTIWNTVFRSPLRPDKKYKYSDLGLFLTARTVRNVSGQTVDVFARDHFYRPMGLATMTFNPWQRGWVARCVPTEEDRYFRQQRLQGYVHDMGAAMLGGVSGHAGLFSNCNDLAKIFQMLLNGGTYFGHRYIQQETVQHWTTRYTLSTRRGIGFDMKELDPKETMNMSELAGPNTFGHTGFTGISVWADPDQHLIFIFMSNRTYPTMENNKLINGNYRPRIQGIVYRAIMDKK
jgi:beta-glucosidase-like glycosyl hydrolase/CubicO group peptidase (beta-lactamase class C family)